MPEPEWIPPAANLGDMLTSLYTQLYLMRSQVAAWQSSSTASASMNMANEETEKAFSLMEQCCQMDWEIGQSLLAVLQSSRGGSEQKNSSSPLLMGTASPKLNKSLPKAMPRRHPSSLVAAVSASLTTN